MHRRHLLFTAVLTLLVADAAAQITAGRPGPRIQGPMRPPRDATAAPETGTARLRGVVVGGEAGLPLRRAMVQLSGEGLREGRIATTDAEGRWEITELPAGRFTLTAFKAGYVRLQYGQRRPFVPGRPLELRDGQTLENVNFNLPRGAVIAGRIVDEFGEPMAEVSVMPMRYQFFNGRRQLVPAGRFSQTDDGGHFRLYGLPPGEFYLSATLRDPASMMGPNTDRSGYAPTYYPGAISPQQAQPVALGLGGEVTGLTFSLLPVRTATITGTALDPQGLPLAGAFIQIAERNGGMGFMMSFGGNRTREDGTFRLSNVAPGEYTLIARPIGRGREDETATTDISVGSEDISGVVLSPVRGARIRGRVVLEGGAAHPPSPGAFTIGAMPGGDDTPVFWVNTANQVEPDWSFEIRAPRSPVLLRALAAPHGWSVKAVLAGGADVTDTGLTFREGETIDDVQVVLTTVTSQVSGSVLDDRGQPVPDYAVILFADEPSYWTPLSRRIGLARPDQSGAWSFDGLPAGRYLAAAVDAVEAGEERDPSLLERLRAVGTPFTLGESGRHRMQLELVQPY